MPDNPSLYANDADVVRLREIARARQVAPDIMDRINSPRLFQDRYESLVRVVLSYPRPHEFDDWDSDDPIEYIEPVEGTADENTEEAPEVPYRSSTPISNNIWFTPTVSTTAAYSDGATNGVISRTNWTRRFREAQQRR